MLRLAQRALAWYRRRSKVTRTLIDYGLDALAWMVAVVVALIVRFDFNLTLVPWRSALVVGLALAITQFVSGWLTHLYRDRHFYGSFTQVSALFSSLILTAVIVGVPAILFGGLINTPRSTVPLALPIALMLMGSMRYVIRLVRERTRRPAEGASRTLIYGAGYLGASLVRRMLTDRDSPFLPVGLIDDSPARARTWLDGVKVLGTGEQLSEIAEHTGAQTLVVAIARADGALLRSIADRARAAGVSMKVLPPLDEVLEGRSRLRDIRDLSIEDLIGRSPVDTDIESIAGYLTRKRVLVTGAGGSIGAELCRQIHRFDPAELIMLDNDESRVQSAQISILGNGLLDNDEVVLADIRDAEVIEQIFRQRRPEVVFHAAALKHLPMLEKFPDEAWKTNVIGTLNVLRAALAVDVGTFVNVSTDKAANPTSVLGHSKRVAEKLTAWAAERSGQRYLSVRFGNVIGSRGSMLPTFTSLILNGGPVTVTHPEVTRYFMTIPEACQLVVQAGAIGEPREVLILDMGEPVKVLEIARRMIEMSGQDVAIVYTGLRPGEKLHEDLVSGSESVSRPAHPRIMHAFVDSLEPERLDKATWEARCRAESADRLEPAEQP